MYRGRYQQGEELPLAVLCVDGNGTPVAPTEAPTCDLWSASALVKTLLLPALDRAAVVGLFGKRLFVDAGFPAGIYQAIYRWRTNAYSGLSVDEFEVVAGGDPGGAVISMTEFKKLPNRYFIQQLDSGKLVRGKNPRF